MENLKEQDSSLYVYYARRQGVGTCPKEGLEKVENYEQEKFEPSVQRIVTAKLFYNRELEAEELKSFELYKPWDAKDIFKSMHFRNLNSQLNDEISSAKEEEKHNKEVDTYLEAFDTFTKSIANRKAFLLVKEENLDSDNKATLFNLDYLSEALMYGNFESGCDVALDTKKNEFILADYKINGTFSFYSYSVTFPLKQLPKELAETLMEKADEQGYVDLEGDLYNLQGDAEMGKELKKELMDTYRNVRFPEKMKQEKYNGKPFDKGLVYGCKKNIEKDR